MIILTIETSCDDTCVALVELKKGQMKILADFVSSQVKIHAPYGGVVPHLASRAHYRNLPILLEKTLAKIEPKKIDLVVMTVGPGLEPSLWAGIRLARLLSLSLKKPIIGVNHLEGHIAANFIGRISNFEPVPHRTCPGAGFPAICLIVSGGHTQLVLIKNIGRYKVIGQTRDDAAGEAFDKVAKLLGLGYPGGPIIAKMAMKIKNQPPTKIWWGAKIKKIKFPRPMINTKDYDFSFSGLKTAVLYFVKTLLKNQIKKLTPAICAEFQQAVIDVLVAKTIKAAKEYQVKTVMLTGGVAANDLLRKNLKLKTSALSEVEGLKLKFLVPPKKFCTDNAVMVALAGWWQYLRKGSDRLEKIVAKANFQLSEVRLPKNEESEVGLPTTSDN